MANAIPDNEVDTSTNENKIHHIIDKATLKTVAYAGVIGHSIQYDSEKLSRSERKEVERFMHLFNSQTDEQRAAIMYQMFASTSFDDCDIQMLRTWLKEVAKIMEWSDEEQVCELLGVVLLDAEAEARLREQEVEADAVLDELDDWMCSSPTISEGPPQTPSSSSFSHTFWIRRLESASEY